jgi:hypothetical protein
MNKIMNQELTPIALTQCLFIMAYIGHGEPIPESQIQTFGQVKKYLRVLDDYKVEI